MRKTLLTIAFSLALLPACSNAQATDDLMPALERLAAQGSEEALYHLGMGYHTGAGVQKDPAKALDLFRRAAMAGDALASYKLGCYYDGQGGELVQDDPELALRHKLVAAEAGYALAQQDVAALYARKGDLTTAVAWLEKAVRQGWPDALAAYASVHNGVAGVPRDPVKTAAYFRILLNRTKARDEQFAWLSKLEKGLTPEQQRQAKTLVSAYRAAPTPLTMKALAGQRAALALVSGK